jgi:rod shape-determining protein MreB
MTSSWKGGSIVFQKKAGVDLGSANLIASVSGEGIVMSEPSAVAVDRNTGQTLYYGTSAEKLLEAPPQNIVLLRPFREGVVNDLELAQKLLAFIIRDHFRGTQRLALSIPCSASEIEESAIAEIAGQCGIKYPHVVYSPVAALAGSETGITGQVLVVDIGATQTSMALILNGEISYMKSIPVAGEAYDRAIAEYVLRNKRVRITLRTAEMIKTTIGTVWTENAKQEMQITGKHPDTGQTVTVSISGEEMYRALEEPTAAILEAICIAITHVPSKHTFEVFSNGILLAGGGALLQGLDRMISGVTGVKTVKAQNPITAVCKGLDRILATLGDRAIGSVRNLSALYLNKTRLQA